MVRLDRRTDKSQLDAEIWIVIDLEPYDTHFYRLPMPHNNNKRDRCAPI